MKSKYLFLLIPLIFFISLSLFLWRGIGKDPYALPSALIDKKLPDFQAAVLFHPSAPTSAKSFLGHVSLINVFATWCVSCHVEHSILMEIAKSHQVTLVGLNYKDDQKAAKTWLTQYGNPYQAIIVDPKGDIAINFGVYGTPETFLVDKKGIIRYKYLGPVSPE